MKYILLSLLVFNVMTSALFGVDASLKIEKDVEERARISVIDGSTNEDSKVFGIFQADLKISGHFLPDGIHHVGDVQSDFIVPALKSQEYIIRYNLSEESKTRLFVRLIKVSDGVELFKKSYAIPSNRKMPFLIHKAVSDINKVLGYPDISWINRYVVYAVYTTPRNSEIKLADYTFNYTKTIVKGGLNLFPKWADEKQRALYYTSFKGVIPTLYKLNIYNGTKEKIISSEGMMVCSDVSKDGSKLLLTMAPEGQADIFELDLTTRTTKRVTEFAGIDVNGRYAQDESEVVFISNRLGYANVFKKSIHSPATSQVVYHGRNNNACDAYGDHIVYASRESSNSFGGNTFNIYLASLESSDTRPLTTTGSNQFPRFSSDGSVVLSLKQKETGTSIGYTNLTSYQSLLFPFTEAKVQAIDW